MLYYIIYSMPSISLILYIFPWAFGIHGLWIVVRCAVYHLDGHCVTASVHLCSLDILDCFRGTCRQYKCCIVNGGNESFTFHVYIHHFSAAQFLDTGGFIIMFTFYSQWRIIDLTLRENSFNIIVKKTRSKLRYKA